MIKEKSVSKGIRIPLDLFNLVMSANKGKTFNDVIKDLLIEKYSFSSCAPVKENLVSGAPEKMVIVDNSSEMDFVSNVESEVDKLLCAQEKKKELKNKYK